MVSREINFQEKIECKNSFDNFVTFESGLNGYIHRPYLYGFHLSMYVSLVPDRVIWNIYSMKLVSMAITLSNTYKHNCSRDNGGLRTSCKLFEQRNLLGQLHQWSLIKGCMSMRFPIFHILFHIHSDGGARTSSSTQPVN